MKITIDDRTFENTDHAMFASMNGPEQRGWYWFDEHGKQLGMTCYTIEQVKSMTKIPLHQ